jgi:hypothetical protein
MNCILFRGMHFQVVMHRYSCDNGYLPIMPHGRETDSAGKPTGTAIIRHLCM